MTWDTRPKSQKKGDALSQLLNAWFFNGNPDESLSGRSYFETEIAYKEGRPVRTVWRVVRFLAEVLFYYRDRGDHTRLAFIEDIERAGVRYEATFKYINYV
jgi:hypothetical protein